MRFYVNQDINGHELDTPRPARITWTESMTYQSKTNAATFIGDVSLKSGLESMTCEHMRLLFERDTSADADESPAESGPRPRGMGLDLERYSRRRLAMILANGDVDLRTREEDDAGRLLRRLQLAGDQLMYDLRVDELTMARSGTLVVEDYRPPERGDGEASARPGSQDTQRPSQSAFRWSKRMRLDQNTRQVDVEGDVQLVHRSGKEVLRLEGLKTPSWGALERGRRTLLHCQNLQAHFGEPEPQGAPVEGGDDKYDVGPSLGPLERFIARDEVNLVDSLGAGSIQVLGQRLDYNRATGNVQVWGFIEGRPLADATLVYEDEKGPKTFSNPAMEFVMEGARVVEVRMKKDVYGSGVQ